MRKSLKALTKNYHCTAMFCYMFLIGTLLTLLQPVVGQVLEEDVDQNGDLHLDLAEAYMDNSEHRLALPILQSLVHSNNYDLVSR